MSGVDIGVLQSCEPWRLESRFFPSKIGGKPAWLDLKNIPAISDLKCEYCEKPCVFLCQVYAPYEDVEDAFHRTLFVFICTDVNCCKANENGNVKVFRSQLGRQNEFYPAKPPVEEENWRTDIHVNKYVKTCQVCGILSTNHCAKCKIINYCCREHQLLDWKSMHKNICGKDEKPKEKNLLFPEYELMIDTEDDDSASEQEEQDEGTKEEQELKKFELLVENGQAGTMQSEKDIDNDLVNMSNQLEDKVFARFNDKIKSLPDQVLRYDRGGSPLYISANNTVKSIPPCDYCKGERQFEFQIMPQMINYLELKDVQNGLDWGVLLIFTCKNSCSLSSMYAKEYIWKQDISDENKE